MCFSLTPTYLSRLIPGQSPCYTCISVYLKRSSNSRHAAFLPIFPFSFSGRVELSTGAHSFWGADLESKSRCPYFYHLLPVIIHLVFSPQIATETLSCLISTALCFSPWGRRHRRSLFTHRTLRTNVIVCHLTHEVILHHILVLLKILRWYTYFNT